MNEYRCTRPELFTYTNGPARWNPLSRRGTFIKAVTAKEAWDEMKRLFPEEQEFDVQLWKSNV